MLVPGCSNAPKDGTIALLGLTKICTKCVRCTQSELHNFSTFKYSRAMEAIVIIDGDAVVRLFKRWTPPSMVPMQFMGGEELTKICSKCVRRTQSELHTFWPLQCTSAMEPIVDVLTINGDAASRLFERWTPLSMVPVHFLRGEELTKICSKAVHSQTCTLYPPAVRTMNPSKHGADRVLLQVCLSYTVRATHFIIFFASPAF